MTCLSIILFQVYSTMGCLDSSPKNNSALSPKDRKNPSRNSSPRHQQQRIKEQVPVDSQPNSNAELMAKNKLAHKDKQKGEELDENFRQSHHHYQRFEDNVEEKIAPTHHNEYPEHKVSQEQNQSPVKALHDESTPANQLKLMQVNSQVRIDTTEHKEHNEVERSPLDQPIPEASPEEQREARWNQAPNQEEREGVKEIPESERMKQQQLNVEDVYIVEGILPMDTDKKDLNRSEERLVSMSFIDVSYPDQKFLDNFQEAFQLPLFQLVLS